MLIPRSTDMHVISALLAAAPAQPAAAASDLAVQSVWDFVVKGGVMMIPIGLCSLVALAVAAERLINLRRSAIIPPGFVDGVRGAVKESREKALERCNGNTSPIAAVFAAAVRRLGQPIDLLERHVTEAGERQMVRLRARLRVLSVIAAVTPLMGLLGTIFGMINAFQTVAVSGDALGRTELLAEGIYEAMITTAAGLIVAIPVLILFHWINAKIERAAVEIDAQVTDFIEDFAIAPTNGRSARTAPSTTDNGKSDTADESTLEPAAAGA